jgi:2-dehydro-3-deoxyphosphogluconate aldolase / (4S)-4-hydroxy-2-oxoglutarate aldolase
VKNEFIRPQREPEARVLRGGVVKLMSTPKNEVLGKILAFGLVVVIQAENPDQAARIAEVIEHVAKQFSGKILLGTGTVFDPAAARTAILARAQFATARLCNRYQVPYLPGAGTIREVIEAIIKVFPGEVLGPAFVKAAKGPFPQAQPTGGLSLENVAAWINAGAVAVGVAGNPTAGAKTGDFASITPFARQFVEKITQARGQ